jgi:hypothetical protein
LHIGDTLNYRIKPPVLDDIGGYKEIVYIKTTSSTKQKEALELMAKYFKQEFRYDHLQYNKNDDNSDCTGVLFTKRALDLVNNEDHFPNRIIGGACFRQKYSSEYCLDWIWLHSFARNRGILKNNWQIFKDKFGIFSVTEPLSVHMAEFIKKHHA